MTAVLMVAVLLALWTMYDSGQVMTEKIKLQNTADNVAYSSSALVARDLNFSAYTTRAMVANQVAIGQMFGLSSWATMMERLGQSLGAFGKVASFVPGLGMAITAVTETIQSATSFLSTVVDVVTKADESNNNLSNTNGIPAFYAFRDESRSHMSGLSMVLLFRKKVDAISLIKDLGATGDNPLNTGTAGGWLAAAAKGQPYYARPTDVLQFARRDGNVEYGNLYNPFWQPRLGKLSDAEKSAVAAISGVF
ncbi:pilus assembly protein TadG-related protein [Halomonas sp. CH40]